MHRSSRLAAAIFVAASVAASVGGGLVARAADSPVAAVTDVINAVVAKDFASLPPMICAAKQTQIMASLDITQSLAGTGVDPQTVLDALTMSIQNQQVTLVSQDATTAVVHVAGTLTLSIAIDEATATTMVTTLLGTMGLEATPELVAQYLPMLMSGVNQTQTKDLATDVNVVNEGGQWLLCDSFEGPTPSGSPAPGGSPAA